MRGSRTRATAASDTGPPPAWGRRSMGSQAFCFLRASQPRARRAGCSRRNTESSSPRMRGSRIRATAASDTGPPPAWGRRSMGSQAFCFLRASQPRARRAGCSRRNTESSSPRMRGSRIRATAASDAGPPPAWGRRSMGSQAFCFLRASQPRVGACVLEETWGRHPRAEPALAKAGAGARADAGIQDSCDCGKRHWAPTCVGATINGVAGVLFLESLSAPRRGGCSRRNMGAPSPRRACPREGGGRGGRGDPGLVRLRQAVLGPHLRGGDDQGSRERSVSS